MPMLYAYVKCPQCDTSTFHGVYDDEHHVACPKCHQYNPVPNGQPVATGRCNLCGKPIDAHQMTETCAVVACAK